MTTKLLTISCLCGQVHQPVPPRDGDGEAAQGDPNQRLCHCNTCRHVTGLLYTSYVPIGRPNSLDGLVSYSPSCGSTRYFCSTCGCHLFRSTAPFADDDPVNWEAATGAIVESPGEATDPASEPHWKHLNVADTNDGGISTWINATGSNIASSGVTESKAPNELSRPSPGRQAASDAAAAVAAVAADDAGSVLPGSCHCGTVRFHVTRPDGASQLPRSNFPDLMIPYCRTDPEVVKNPADTKWWLRSGNAKYLAGTCACRSCRLASGFEIQAWAFIPRSNIYFHVHRDGESTDQTSIQPLEFETLPGGILKNYSSSPGVIREFCPNCGATVFWHDEWRPELIDVSVGLLCAPEGARADSWLDWWRGRVSFTEDTGSQRTGVAARRAQALIQRLELGLRESVRSSRSSNGLKGG